MKVDIYSFENQQVLKALDLQNNFKEVLVDPTFLTKMVKYQLAKRQSGTHVVKTRSEICATTKKLYRQKGTGGARHGSKNANVFRGGYKAHGPKFRSHAFSLTKKFRRLALMHAVASKFQSEAVAIYDDFVIGAKTKDMVAKIQSLNLEGKKVLLVSANASDNADLKKSCANLHKVNVIPTIGLNVYDLLKHDHILFTEASIQELEERIHV